MNLTESSVRRLAWVTFASIVALYATAVALAIAVGTTGNGGGPVFAAATFAFPLMGFLICRRQPRNRIGWILLVIGVVWGLSLALNGYAQAGRTGVPGSVPGWDVAEALSKGLWIPGLGLMGTFLILLFPDGHLPTSRWRPVAWASAVMIVVVGLLIPLLPGHLVFAERGVHNPLGVEALRPIVGALAFPIGLLPVFFVLCAVALVLRFRRSRGVERLQLKWLATAAAPLAFMYFVTLAATVPWAVWGNGSQPGLVSGLQAVCTVLFGLVPVAIAVAVLRHNLYEIDVVISKAVVFGALAVFITGVYVAIVVALGAVLPHVLRRNSLVLSLLATALVAVAFQPVRLWVQRHANRLVYGARATPYEVLSEFAARMGRTRPATDQLSYLARTLAEGLGASRAEVWLRVGPDLAREAVWPPDDNDPEAVPVPGAVVADGVAGKDRLPALAGDRVVAVRQEGELLGAIAVSKAVGESMTPAEEKLLDDVAAQAGLVLRNARLIEDLRSSRQRLVSAQDEERRRLERNLHDGAQQSFVAVALTLRMASGQLARSSPEAAQPFEAASEQLSAAIEELRELARGIHPAILTERGLSAAVTSLAERSPVPVTVADHLDGRAPAALEATAYFVVAEALTNAAKHAHAPVVGVDLDRVGEQLVVSVADDGQGGVDPAHGSGLRGLADRIAAVDGTLEVDSRLGQGTRITCRLPLPRTRAPQPRAGQESAEPPAETGRAPAMSAKSGGEG